MLRALGAAATLALYGAAFAQSSAAEIARDLGKSRAEIGNRSCTLLITSGYWDGKETLDSLGGSFRWTAGSGACRLERREVQRSSNGDLHPVRGGWFRWKGTTFRYSFLDDTTVVPTAGSRRLAEMPLPTPCFAGAYGDLQFDRLALLGDVKTITPREARITGQSPSGPFDLTVRLGQGGWRLHAARLTVVDRGVTYQVVLSFPVWKVLSDGSVMPLEGTFQTVSNENSGKPIAFKASQFGPGEEMDLSTILRIGSVVADTEGTGQWLEMSPQGVLVASPMSKRPVNPWGLVYVASSALLVLSISGLLLSRMRAGSGT